eukprot:gene17720-biopygen6850
MTSSEPVVVCLGRLGPLGPPGAAWWGRLVPPGAAWNALDCLGCLGYLPWISSSTNGQVPKRQKSIEGNVQWR